MKVALLRSMEKHRETISGMCIFIGIAMLSGVTPENPGAEKQLIFALVLFIIAAIASNTGKSGRAVMPDE